MNTVHSLVDQLINPKTVMSKVKEILREVDPEYEKEEQNFIAACSALEAGMDDSIPISAHCYLEALEEEFASDIVFVIGRGLSSIWISSITLSMLWHSSWIMRISIRSG